ncbi:MAG TPA: WecB/TagA/CpsF family glycosyltransferase [Candidatus Magasanikbacteria bacterium]|nr:WecB/TagA/CpsF family glycosyltransferase [Candidatus Magasanikbacteria bacterium]
MRLKILDIPIDNFSHWETLNKIKDFLHNKEQNLITTPNPEMLVDADKDWFFKEIFYRSSLNIADGFGLVLAAKYLYHQKLNRYPGIDLMLDVCRLAEQEKRSIFLLGSKQETLDQLTQNLLKLYPQIKIAGATAGLKISVQHNGADKRVWHNEFLTGLDFDQKENKKIIDQINQVKPDILFAAFGHIKQEKWLISYLNQIPSVKVAMGVGGAFNYLSGCVKRAPKMVRQLGLEWFWRLLSDPKYRTQRVFKATFTFLKLIKEYKQILKKPYKKGVVGFIIDQNGQFFIAKRTPEKNDCYSLNTEHWQPPQGGVDSKESLAEAVIRETEEETGMKTQILCAAQDPHLYNWSFTSSTNPRFWKYRGAEKYPFLLQYNGDGADIKLDKQELCDYKWVDLTELKRIIHPSRRESLEILLRDCSGQLPFKAK